MGSQRVRHDSDFHFQRTTPKLQYLKPGSSSVTEEINWKWRNQRNKPGKFLRRTRISRVKGLTTLGWTLTQRPWVWNSREENQVLDNESRSRLGSDFPTAETESGRQWSHAFKVLKKKWFLIYFQNVNQVWWKLKHIQTYRHQKICLQRTFSWETNKIDALPKWGTRRWRQKNKNKGVIHR